MPCIIRNWTEFEAWPIYSKDGFYFCTKCSMHNMTPDGTRKVQEGLWLHYMQFHAVEVLTYSEEGSEEAVGEDANSRLEDVETKAEEILSNSLSDFGDSDSFIVVVYDSKRIPDLIDLAGEDGSSTENEMSALAKKELPGTLRLRETLSSQMPLPRRTPWLISSSCLSRRTCPGSGAPCASVPWPTVLTAPLAAPGGCNAWLMRRCASA